MFKGHMNSVFSVAFSPDGTHIVSGSSDNSVRVWDSSMGEVYPDWVLSVAFSSDSRYTLSGSKDNLVGGSDMLLERLAPPYIQEMSVGLTHTHEYTGWLLSPHGGEYLMFVPIDNRLPDATNILTIPCSLTACVDFTRSTLGLRWQECYSP